MANKILILGEPGTGKTTAARNLDPTETFFIVPDEKSLPFKGWKNIYKTVYKPDGKIDISKSNLYRGTSPQTIMILLKAISDTRPDIKVVIIDTITMMMNVEYMAKAKEKGYEKFLDLALDVFNLIKMIDGLREDLTVFILGHVQSSYDTDGSLRTEFKVIGGKLIGEKIEVEGMFTNVLYTEVVMKEGKPEYFFLTQNNGKNTCKSALGLFPELRIPNDFKIVLEEIKKYDS